MTNVRIKVKRISDSIYTETTKNKHGTYKKNNNHLLEKTITRSSTWKNIVGVKNKFTSETKNHSFVFITTLSAFEFTTLVQQVRIWWDEMWQINEVSG